MHSYTSARSREEAILDAAASQDASRLATSRGEFVDISVDPDTLSKQEADLITVEEEKILGYPPPPGSLAARAKRAAQQRLHADLHAKAGNDDELIAAAAQDAVRISAERGNTIGINLAAVPSEAASRVQAEERMLLGHPLPTTSLAAGVQSITDQRSEYGTAPPMTKDLAANLMSQEAQGMGHRLPRGSLASEAQSLADRNENDGGIRTMEPEVMRVAMGTPVTKDLAAKVTSKEEKNLKTIPKGSISAQAQSVADKNAVDGGLRTLYDA